MPLLGRPCPYSMMDKEDPEEVFHRRARFLIHRVLQEADAVSLRRRPPPPSFLRMRLLRLKVKVGKRLRKLRRSLASAVRSGLRKHSLDDGGGKALKRLFHGGSGAGIPAPIFSLDV
ncbi:PREDICTED: uncharacterized protein LOC104818840 [Tarenaya hassleriana]|uniref:uncharacterized protein LOC104818840 n=1 Tax=Tarenaya hassleriana TaxID=28532 RepID=UPI00053C4F94|nr:PREDICTED: uncharacterized protein LOC104818840 [Tarenaya hassleriana]